MRLPNGAVDAHLGAGQASMRVANAAIPDDLDIVQALFGSPPPRIPAHVTFAVDWRGVSERKHVRDQANRFALEAAESQAATIAWSASHDAGGFSYISDPASTSVMRFAELAEERNGRFFPGA